MKCGAFQNFKILSSIKACFVICVQILDEDFKGIDNQVVETKFILDKKKITLYKRLTLHIAWSFLYIGGRSM